MTRPRVYRQGPGRWMVHTRLLPFHVGPFTTQRAAFTWARFTGLVWT